MAAGPHVQLRQEGHATQLGPDPDDPYRQPAAAARADPALCAARARRCGRRGRDRPRRPRGGARRSSESSATAGIDVGNNGEQQRDSFFLYLKARLSGLGGSWERPSRADVDRYPEFKRMWTEQHAAKTQVSALGGLPKAVGEVRYLDDRAINDECRHFKAVLDEQPDAFVEPFMSAPSPGILAMAVKNEHYDTLEAYLAALGKALQVEYEAIVQHGFLLQIDAPDLALERHITYKDQPVAAFVGFVEQVVATINRALDERAARARPPARVLGEFRIAARQRRAARGHSADPAAGQGRRLRAAVRQSAPRARVPLLREIPARRRPGPGRRRDRQPDQFRRASGSGGGPHRARRRP